MGISAAGWMLSAQRSALTGRHQVRGIIVNCCQSMHLYGRQDQRKIDYPSSLHVNDSEHGRGLGGLVKPRLKEVNSSHRKLC